MRLAYPLFQAALLSATLVTSAAADDQIMPLDQVKSGMQGHGRTVFRGTKIETFPFEVIDVLRNWNPGTDVILVKCGGETVGRAKIIQGMSGSPCYIDGKLIGALAYGWSFNIDALAGITPIEEMIKIADRPLEKNAALPPRRGTGKYGGLEPCKAPLFVSARSRAGLEFLEKALDRFDLVPMSSGGGGMSDLDAPIEPGSAVSVLLMTGDMEMFATGTVTWVSGGRMLAFGHPFFGSGEHSMPVANTWTYAVVARDWTSFKLSAPGRIVGTMLQDRQNGIFAVLDRKPALLPFAIRVENGKTRTVHEYSMRIIDHREWTGNLVTFAVVDAVASAEPCPEEEAREIEISYKPRGYAGVKVGLFRASGGWFSPYVMLEPLTAFLDNPFEEAHVDSVSVSIRTVHEDLRGDIYGVSVAREEYFPGETVSMAVDVRRPRKEPETFGLKFTLPVDLPAGQHAIEIRPQDQIPEPDAPAIENVGTLLDRIRRLGNRDSRKIIAVLRSPDYTLQHKGQSMDNLPLTMLSQLLPTFKTGKYFIKSRHFESEPVPTGLYLSGGKTVKITVKKKLAD